MGDMPALSKRNAIFQSKSAVTEVGLETWATTGLKIYILNRKLKCSYDHDDSWCVEVQIYVTFGWHLNETRCEACIKNDVLERHHPELKESYGRLIALSKQRRDLSQDPVLHCKVC